MDYFQNSLKKDIEAAEVKSACVDIAKPLMSFERQVFAGLKEELSSLSLHAPIKKIEMRTIKNLFAIRNLSNDRLYLD